jgi:hypothetical protein
MQSTVDLFRHFETIFGSEKKFFKVLVIVVDI